jgi:uncharacterized protein YecT (DUF1311 family)
MTLQEYADIDKQLLKAYHHHLKFMNNSDAKHNIFISDKRGGGGILDSDVLPENI